MKGASAIEKYGEKAKNGVIEIILKTDAEVLQENKKEQNQRSAGKEQNFTSESISFTISEKHNKNVSEVKISNVHDAKLSSSKALYVVDGKEMDKDFDPDSIEPNEIESLTVLKGPRAIEKYGKKASEGVIEITTKK